MTKIADYVLYKNIPSIDFHGKNRFETLVELREFINNNYHLKYKFIKIIHGHGTGVLKETIHQELKTNKKIQAYQIDFYNSGTTIALIKEN